MVKPDSLENSQLGNINISIIHKTEMEENKGSDSDEIVKKEDPSFLDDISNTFKGSKL
jgi:hypothetical protein